MVRQSSEREELLRQEYLSQTARIKWRDLQVHYARGAVIWVRGDCNLVEIAVQLGLDNATELEAWIDAGEVNGVTEEQALSWYEQDCELWAVVAAPWVLVQDRAV